MSTGSRLRLDHELVRRGLFPTRRQAQAAIVGRRVLVSGTLAEKAARLVSAAEPILLQGPGPRFASRGGEKLAPALARFGIDVAGARVLDAGSSTGGFSDCLLQRGAGLVFAVDVGHGQLDARLRADPRVVVLERTNVRRLTPAVLAAAEGHGDVPAWAPVDVVTADLSFISLTAVAPVLVGPVVRAGGDVVVLVKPQFEAGRAEVSRGKGVVRDPATWSEAVVAVASALGDAGAAIMGAMPSPITGPAGNVEFFLHASAGQPARPTSDVRRMVAAAMEEAQGGDGEDPTPTSFPTPDLTRPTRR